MQKSKKPKKPKWLITEMMTNNRNSGPRYQKQSRELEHEIPTWMKIRIDIKLIISAWKIDKRV